jgi:hypothetical protein
MVLVLDEPPGGGFGSSNCGPQHIAVARAIHPLANDQQIEIRVTHDVYDVYDETPTAVMTAGELRAANYRIAR